MKKQEELAHYLASKKKDYARGVKIFKALDIDRKSNDFFDVDEPSALHVNLLNKKLNNYARVNKIKPELKTSGKQKTTKISGSSKNEITHTATSGKNEKVFVDTNPTVRFEDLPVEYQDKYKRAGELTNEQKTLQAELKALKDKEDEASKKRREELSKDIVDKKKEIKALWEAIDKWWNENKDKTKEQQIADQAATSAIEKEKRIKANRTYIQRNYGKEKKAEELAKRMNELDKWGVDYSEDIKKAGGSQTS